MEDKISRIPDPGLDGMLALPHQNPLNWERKEEIKLVWAGRLIGQDISSSVIRSEYIFLAHNKAIFVSRISFSIRIKH